MGRRHGATPQPEGKCRAGIKDGWPAGCPLETMALLLLGLVLSLASAQEFHSEEIVDQDFNMARVG